MAERIPKVQIYLYVLLIEKRNSLIWFGCIPGPPTADFFLMSKGTPYEKWTTYSSRTGCGYPTLSLKLSDIPWFFFPSPACQSLAPLAGLGTGRRRAGTMRRIPALWPPRHPAGAPCCWNGGGWDGRSSAIHRKLAVSTVATHSSPKGNSWVSEVYCRT